MAVTQVKRSIHKKQSTKPGTRKRTARNRSTSPSSFALVERKLPCRRFVEFPQVNGKAIKQIHFYTATDYHSITIDFQDHTSLNLEIEPGFTINAELQQIKKGETHTLAEWPRIRCQS